DADRLKPGWTWSWRRREASWSCRPLPTRPMQEPSSVSADEGSSFEWRGGPTLRRNESKFQVCALSCARCGSLNRLHRGPDDIEHQFRLRQHGDMAAVHLDGRGAHALREETL